jgi:acetylglutamate kinase
VRTRVFKFGGRAQGAANLPRLITSAASVAGNKVVVVHGGGDEVSAMQRRLGMEPQFVGGRRVTSEADLEVVRMLLSGTVNKRLVAELLSAGARAVGISGEDASLLTARVTDETFGRVGRDVEADVTLLEDLMHAGWLPVVSPLARDRESATGAGLNVNGDDAATAIAVALGADELCFVADVDGVLENGARIPRLDSTGIRDLATRGVVQGGMLAKLEAAMAAIASGVGTVRIGTLDTITDPQAGTTIVSAVSAT